MASQNDSISGLIADIDGVLHKTSYRWPWSKSGNAAVESRRVLERVRNYLRSLQQKTALNPPLSQKATNSDGSFSSTDDQTQLIGRQIVQAVVKEIDACRANLINPLEADLEMLRQQRESLVREIHQLETTRQHYRSLSQQQAKQQQIISEFLQVLMSRLQEEITQQQAQTLKNLETQFLSADSLSHPNSGTTTNVSLSTPASLHPQERLEQLRMLQVESDHLLMTIDSTLRTVFEALQRNIHSYEESLSQKLENMHNLGQQGEVVLTQLINQLIAGAKLVDQTETPVSQPEAPTPPLEPTPPEETPLASADEVVQPTTIFPANNLASQDQLPFAGIEWPIRSVERQQPETLDLQSLLNPESVSSESEALSLTASSEQFLESTDINDIDWESLGASEIDDDDMQTLLQLDAVLGISPDRGSRDIEAVYQSLFGAEAFTAEEPQLDSAASADAAENTSESQLSSPNQVSDAEFSAQLEEVLFAGLSDPSEQSTQLRHVDWANPQTEQMWADFLSPEDWDESILQVESPSEVEALNNTATSTAESDEDVPLVISALTDLFPQTPADELSSGSNVQETGFGLVSNPLPLGEQSQSLSAASQEQDTYIPASPDESLLATEEAESDGELAFWLDQDTLQQLSEDLSSFGTTEIQSFQGYEEILGTADEAVAERTNSAETEDQSPDDTAPFTVPLEPLHSAEVASEEDWGFLEFENFPEEVVDPLAEFGDLEGISTEENTDSELSSLDFGFLDALQEELNLDLESESSPETLIPEIATENLFEDDNLQLSETPIPIDEENNSSAELESLSDETLIPEIATENLFEDDNLQLSETPIPMDEENNSSAESESLPAETLIPEIATENLFEEDYLQLSETPIPMDEENNSSAESESLPAKIFTPEIEAETLSNSTPIETSNITAEDPIQSVKSGVDEPPQPLPSNLESPDSEKKKLTILKSKASVTKSAETITKDTINLVWSQEEGETNFTQNIPQPFARNPSNEVWYLGIDCGTSSLSAVLLNHSTGERYPIYWTTGDQLKSPQNSFRLPAIAYSGPVVNDGSQSSVAAIAMGSLVSSQEFSQTGIFIQNFKPYLKIGIPYMGIRQESSQENIGKSATKPLQSQQPSEKTQLKGANKPEETRRGGRKTAEKSSSFKGDWERQYSSPKYSWEPLLQWSGQQPVSLYWVCRAMQGLLATLKPEQASGVPQTNLIGAVGLHPETLSTALNQLSGVILGCPAGWGDTYRFNLREAILGTQLVKHPEQIFFLEDAIATVLAGMSGSALPGVPWRGGTLVINAGATTTELALVNLPNDFQDLTHSDFSIRSFPYAGNAIDQDIICQLLYPQTKENPGNSQALVLSPDLNLPAPGEPDLENRYRLASVLQSSVLGQALLDAASYLKRILQSQDSYTLELGGYSWIVQRRELESRVLSPFIEQLNRELNSLLIETGTSIQGINQIVCTGGTAAVGEIAKWLQRKVPKAVLIRDAEATGRLFTETCSPVAYGLATLPLYPQVLEQQPQQYSDYFLLLELLRTLPNRPVSVEEITQRLEHRGINTRTCLERIMAFLNNQLPAGLVPSSAESSLLTPTSQQNPDYQAITAAPLFYKQADQLYRPNPQQCVCIHRYLQTILASTRQKLEEPLSINLLTARRAF